MKRLIAAAMVMAPLTVIAQPDVQTCQTLARVMAAASGLHEAGDSPQQALATLKQYFPGQLPDASLKKAVNAVYFDPSFANIADQDEMEAFVQACARPARNWQPLK